MRFGLTLTKWTVLCAGIMLVLLRVRSAGKQAEKLNALEHYYAQREHTLRTTRKIRTTIRQLDHPADELRTHWSRD